MEVCPGFATRTFSSPLWRGRNRSGITRIALIVPMLAAAYAFGLVKNHPYRDGNKRIGFLAMVTFLGMNGYDFSATDADVVAEIVALADGTFQKMRSPIGFDSTGRQASVIPVRLRMMELKVDSLRHEPILSAVTAVSRRH